MYGPDKVLTPERWMAYISMFDELRLAVYETMGSVVVDEEEDSVNDGGKVQSLLELREIDEQFRSQLLYSVHELMANMRLEDVARRDVATRWMEHVREIVQPLLDSKPEDIIKIRP
jgi:hypothetical protein